MSESILSPSLLSGFIKKINIMTAITSGIYHSKFVIRRNPYQVNKFLIAEDYPLFHSSQLILYRM